MYFSRFTHLQPGGKSLGQRQAGGVVRCGFAGVILEAAWRGDVPGLPARVRASHGGAGVTSGSVPSGTGPAHAATAATAFKPASPKPRPRARFSRSRPEVFPLVGRGVRPRGTPLLPTAPRRKGCSRHLLPSASQGISACFFFPAVSYSFSPGKPEECFALQTAERWGRKDNVQGLKKLAIAWRISLKNFSEIFCSSLIEVNKVQ